LQQSSLNPVTYGYVKFRQVAFRINSGSPTHISQRGINIVYVFHPPFSFVFWGKSFHS
jgi:hypothetical protein